MATAAAAIDQAAHPKSVDESLWWDSFVHLFNDLESASLSTELPSSLIKKLKNNHAWFLDTVSLFKPPNQKSRAALDSHQIDVGPHRLIVQPKLKDLALHISSSLGLDEVQSYILVTRSVESENFAEDIKVQQFLHLISLQYYIERQCLLKCTRQIIMHASYIGNGSEEGDAISEEALKLLSDGLDRKLLSVIRGLLSSKHLEHMEVDLATLWAEEILIEDNLVLDIFFLAYYESFGTCNGEQWRSLCLLYKEMLSGSFNSGKLAISVEARNLFNHSKVQLLLILIETLDLENLLRMVHDEVPFSRQGHSVFTLMDIQDMDAMISSFNAFEMEEAAPLILAWAIFLCLLTSLPEKQDNNVLMEIDHVGYVRQAFKAAPLSYVLKILENDISKDSDAPTTGHRSVLRTFVSAFIASYEITLQLEDGTLNLILDILCKIYRGEESLCVRFWDRESFIDGPIRCLLCTLEGEFPFRTVELVRFLSALGEGTWPAECVYNFLDKAVGISSLFEVSDDIGMENTSEIETHQPLNVPGVEDLLIPSHTRGHVLKVIDGNTVLVRWEYTQSGVIVLLLRLAQRLLLNYDEETLFTLDLLCRLVSFSPTVCFALMGPISFHVQTAHMNDHVEQSMRVDVIEIICTLVRNLSSNVNATAVMSMSISILANMLKCLPSHVIAVVLKKDIFEVALNTNNFDVASNRSGMWLLSGGLARILLIDCELAVDCCPLTISVLDFTMQLVETGAEDDIVLALVVFSLQYVFVNHEHWKYKMKHVRWKVTLKVLEVLKKCIMLIPISRKLGGIVRDILLCDSSVHNTLCRIMCITSTMLEKLYVSRLYEVEEIEGLHTAVCAVLDIVFTTLSTFSKDDMSSLPGFHQAMLSSSTKPIPVVTAAISLISYFRDPAIQVGAAKVLSMLCIIAENAQPYLFGDVCLVSDEMQISDLRYSIYDILCEETPRNEDLFVAIIKLLTCAARYQPAFLVSMIATKETMEVPLKQQSVSFGPLKSKKVSLIDALLQYVKRSSDLIERHPHLLLNMLNFLKVLWQGATQYVQILELLKTTEMFWKQLSSSISSIATKKSPSLDNQTEDETRHLAYKYQCHSAILEIIAYDMFLEKKLLQVELPSKQTSEPSKERIENKATLEKSKAANRTDLKNILSAWCESSVVGDLIKSYASCRYDEKIFFLAKIAASSFLVHVMGKLTIGDAGSMSLSLIEKIQNMSKKLRDTPAFSELLGQYSLRGYSVGKELNILILSDLYYHIQGELEGREINPGPFKELTRCLHELNFSQTDEHKYNRDFPTDPSDVYLFDLVRLRADLGLQFWDHSEWKASKAIAKRMLLYMQDANLMAFLAHSKLSALKALTTIVSVYEGNLTEIKTTSIGGWISESLIGSCIDHICKCLQTTVESLVPDADPCEDVISFLGAQADLLFYLIRFLYRILSKKANRQLSLSVCTLVLKTSGAGLRMLSSIRSSIVGVRETMKLFLTLLLMSVGFCHSSSRIEGPDKETVEAFSEVSLLNLGLLPILCRCIEMNEYCTLSLATMDLILKGYLTSNTWLPIIRKHLQLQLVIQKLREKDFPSISIVLKFLLSLARVRGGAEMLQSARFFSSLKVVFDILLDKKPFLNTQCESDLCSSPDKDEKSKHIWGLGLAVITAIIYSLGDSSSCVDIVDSIIPYFFCEKAYLMFYHLNAPDFPSEDHDKKRARTQKTQTSLTALRETEHTLMLICVLAKHRNSWAKAMKEMDSQLREKSIHLLAFISRGAQRIGESPSRTAPLICPPILKDEIESNRQHSLINSKRGWFSLSPLGCVSKSKVSAVSCTALVPLIKDQTTENADSVLQTHFSDTVTIQLYRNAFLLLKFLCLQAKEAAKRAEDVGFIDLAHFPELPMPEILHGLQDQAIAIVTELCEANKLKQMRAEIQDVCFLLLNIMEMALYLELCVSQTCGIRPVLGRVEDFSKELKTLMQVIEEHTYFKSTLKSLKQIVSLVYPGLLQSEGL